MVSTHSPQGRRRIELSSLQRAGCQSHNEEEGKRRVSPGVEAKIDRFLTCCGFVSDAARRERPLPHKKSNMHVWMSCSHPFLSVLPTSRLMWMAVGV